jgi:hypothetical protein
MKKIGQKNLLRFFAIREYIGVSNLLERLIDPVVIKSLRAVCLRDLDTIVEYYDISPTRNNIYSILAILLMIYSKYVEDIPYNNQAFATQMDLDLDKINVMELECLTAINFQVSVKA